MHARAVVAEDRLRHEGRGLAIGMGDLMNDIFVDLHLVGVAGQRVELHAEFVLRRRHLVVMLFDLDAHFGHDGQHFAAVILAGIDRRNREIAALGARTVAHIAAFIVGVGVGRQFGAIELESRYCTGRP